VATGKLLGILREAAALLLTTLLAAGQLLGVLREAAALLLTTLLAAGQLLGVLCDLVHGFSPPSPGRSCQPGRVSRPVKAMAVSAVLACPSERR